MAGTLSGVYTDLPMDFPGGSGSKASAYNAGDPGWIPGWGRYPEEGNGYPTPVFLPGEFHAQRSLESSDLNNINVQRDGKVCFLLIGS